MDVTLDLSRYQRLKNLARKAEEASGDVAWSKAEKWLRLSAVYREMAEACGAEIVSAEDVAERTAIIDRLRAMAEASESPEADQYSAMELLWKMGER